MHQLIEIDKIIFRKDLYPRFTPNPKLIQQYSECIEELPPIQVAHTNILIDGYHRWKAFETAKQDKIPCDIITVKSEEEIFWLAAKANSAHGLQLSQEEKRSIAIKRCGTIADEEIYTMLSIDPSTYWRWTKDKKDEQKRERNKQIFDLWLACYSQREIGDKLKEAKTTIHDVVGKLHLQEFDQPKDFEPQLYDVWNFHKATNEVKHPGNIPPEIVENLLHYYTNPLDIVFDPFGGGGATIDVCKKWNRRYYVSDIAPIPARSHEMRQWDISKGIPISSKLTFLDPPYYKKKEKEYTQDSISNLDRLEYLEFFKKLAKGLYAKQKAQTYTAFLMSNYVDYENRQDSIWVDDYVDIFKTAGFIIDMQIQCPLSTQQYKGFQVNQKKAHKQLMIISRELIVWTKS